MGKNYVNPDIPLEVDGIPVERGGEVGREMIQLLDDGCGSAGSGIVMLFSENPWKDFPYLRANWEEGWGVSLDDWEPL